MDFLQCTNTFFCVRLMQIEQLAKKNLHMHRDEHDGVTKNLGNWSLQKKK